jgi:hypothetical protein
MFARLATVLLGISALVAHAGDNTASDIRKDEVVDLFPTAAARHAESRAWVVPIHGVIYEPETNSIRRAALVGSLRLALGLDDDSVETAIFRRRVRLFLVDNQSGKTIRIRIGGRAFSAGKSAANGHFQTELTLSEQEIDALRASGEIRDGRLTFQTINPAGDSRQFTGRVCVVEPEGLSVASDIDDTIKISEVRDKKKLLLNTFARQYAAVPGMADLYAAVAKAAGDRPAAFHYVSASPWQLYRPLEDFLRAEGFPAGAFHLKHFRVKDKSLLDLFGSQEDYKTGILEELLRRYPKRRFLLIGDTGEQDPEIFGRLAANHAEQVVGVLLRNTTSETSDNPRMKEARRNYAGVWILFHQPGRELRTQCEALAAPRRER